MQCTVIRAVETGAFPVLVEAEMTDALGVTWRFIDKSPIFGEARDEFPRPGLIRCSVVAQETQRDGTVVVVIDTSSPDNIEAVGGEHSFRVPVGVVHP